MSTTPVGGDKGFAPTPSSALPEDLRKGLQIDPKKDSDQTQAEKLKMMASANKFVGQSAQAFVNGAFDAVRSIRTD